MTFRKIKGGGPKNGQNFGWGKIRTSLRGRPNGHLKNYRAMKKGRGEKKGEGCEKKKDRGCGKKGEGREKRGGV